MFHVSSLYLVLIPSNNASVIVYNKLLFPIADATEVIETIRIRPGIVPARVESKCCGTWEPSPCILNVFGKQNLEQKLCARRLSVSMP